MASSHHPVTVVQDGQPTHVILSIEEYESYCAMREERDQAVNELARYEAEHGVGRSFTNLQDLFADLHSGDKD